MTSLHLNMPVALKMAHEGASFREIARIVGGGHGLVRLRLLKHGYRREPRCKRNRAPLVTIKGDVARLRLPCGQTSILDAECVDLLERWTWVARFGGDYSKPYVARQTSGSIIKLHRVIMSAAPGQIVDHINGDTLDNRKNNLRFATPAGNSQNRGPSKNNKSGYKGVSRFRDKWQASIRSGPKSYNLGHYADPVEAAVAYDRAASRLFGEFAWLNFPDRLWDRNGDARSDNEDRRP